MVSALGYSQTTLKGPKAKNATAAELATNALPMVFNPIPNDLKGPQRKNQKVWKKAPADAKTVYIRREDEHLKGPKAKNKKVWKD